MTTESTHISVFIARTAADVYAYASDPANLPAWAAGLSTNITRDATAGSPTPRWDRSP